MPITLGRIKAAVAQSLTGKAKALAAEAALFREKQAEQAARDAEWRAEQERRRIAELDEDGSRARARAERETRLEEDRLAEMTAWLVRRTKH